MIFTGRPDFMASSEACAASMDGYSSLPPNAPPVSAWITRMFSAGKPVSATKALCT
jgi:hypothetical protein